MRWWHRLVDAIAWWPRGVSPQRAVGFSLSSTSCIAVGVMLGGHDISRLTRAVRIEAVVGEPIRVDVELIAHQGLDVTLPAHVAVTCQVVEDGVIDVTDDADGKRRYTFKRVGA